MIHHYSNQFLKINYANSISKNKQKSKTNLKTKNKFKIKSNVSKEIALENMRSLKVK